MQLFRLPTLAVFAAVVALTANVDAGFKLTRRATPSTGPQAQMQLQAHAQGPANMAPPHPQFPTGPAPFASPKAIGGAEHPQFNFHASPHAPVNSNTGASAASTTPSTTPNNWSPRRSPKAFGGAQHPQPHLPWWDQTPSSTSTSTAATAAAASTPGSSPFTWSPPRSPKALGGAQHPQGHLPWWAQTPTSTSTSTAATAASTAATTASTSSKNAATWSPPRNPKAKEGDQHPHGPWWAEDAELHQKLWDFSEVTSC